MSTIAIDSQQTIVEELGTRRQRVEDRLHDVRRRVRLQLLLEGMAWTCGCLCLLTAVSLAADWFFRPDLWIRLGCLAVALGVLLSIGLRRLRPLLLRLGPLDVAMLVDRHRPGIGQKVANVIELPRLLEGTVRVSPSMIRAAVVEDARVLENTDFISFLDSRRQWRFAALLVASLAIPAGFAIVRPAVAELWVQRWLLGSNVRWPQLTYLSIVGLGDDGRMLVPRGEPVIIQVDAEPEFVRHRDGWQVKGRGGQLAIPSKEMPQSVVPDQVSLRYWSEDEPVKRGNFTRFGGKQFRYELPPVQQPLHLTVTAGDDWIGPITIEPRDRPAIETLTLHARLPGNRGSETKIYEGGDSQLLFLLDTQLELRMTSTMPLETATLGCNTGDAPRLEPDDAGQYVARWTMREAQVLEIQMVSREGGISSRPSFLSIGLLKDRVPRVTVRSSGVRRRITPQARIPLSVRALDDFGLTQLGLVVQTVAPEQPPENKTQDIDGGKRSANQDGGPITELETETTVSVKDMKLVQGTFLKLRAQATDDCAQGSQVGESRWLSFQVVSPEELFYEILMRQRALRVKFEAALKTAQSQADTLDAAVVPEQSSALSRRHQVVSRQIWQVANRLDASLQEMRLNELGTTTALNLLQDKIIAPMRELQQTEMANMRSVLESLGTGPEPLDTKREEAKKLQDEIVQIMQRILKQMSQWESFVDVVNQLRGIIKMQDTVLEGTEGVRKKKIKGVFDD